VRLLSIVFALLTALANGTASVLQRIAARDAPPSKALHLSLFGYLIKRKVWLAGISLIMVAALCQGVALANGPVALVQPIFIIELPFTLLLANRILHRRLPRLTWGAVALVTISLGVGLAAAAPSGGVERAPFRVWLAALVVTGAFEVVVISVGIRLQGNARAAALALAAACGYALTAALIKGAVDALRQGVVPFFTSWELYAGAAAGVGALFLLQNSLQAGSLVAAQPPLTLGDALISVAYGVSVFGEQLRTGIWLAVQIVCVMLIGVGCVELSRSLASTHEVEDAAPPAVSPRAADA
jgi:drug/metabolite transporter (DMT)-like permease